LLVETVHPEMGPFRTVRSPVTFDGERATDVVAPPTLGEHNDAILSALRERMQKRADEAETGETRS
jgi:crotonobetainyl-CoA:carnitine CoA-transferase CaiB-like acyl-CoA transferase